MLPMLLEPGDTLAPTSDPAVHRAGDDLLLRLYPRGSGEQITLEDGTVARSTVAADRIELRVTGAVQRLYQVDAPLAGAPRGVVLDGRPLPRLAGNAASSAIGWRYDAAHHMVSVTARLASGTLIADS